jgi:adenylate cyclase
LLPAEKKAIEHRGTTSPKAYKYFLMARQISVTGNLGNMRHIEAIERLATRATELDPGYARAWALLASAQTSLKVYHFSPRGDGGVAAAERSLALDAKLADGHAALARILVHAGKFDVALAEAKIALALDPDSYEANNSAGRCHYALRQYREAIPLWEKSVAAIEADYQACGMMISCYERLGDMDGLRRAAQRTLVRAEKIVAVEPDNGSAMSFIVTALAALGEVERAKDWIERAMLLDPGNLNMAYNFACTLASNFRDAEAALDLLEPMMEHMGMQSLNWSKVDSDLDSLRELPRFKTMIAKAEARLGTGS